MWREQRRDVCVRDKALIIGFVEVNGASNYVVYTRIVISIANIIDIVSCQTIAHRTHKMNVVT